MKGRSASKIKLTSYDELLGGGEETNDIQQVALEHLHSFENHPFQVNDDEAIKYRKASTLTLQQVKEPILSFEEFNEMMERESAMPVEAVGNVQDTVVVEEAEEIEERNNWN